MLGQVHISDLEEEDLKAKENVTVSCRTLTECLFQKGPLPKGDLYLEVTFTYRRPLPRGDLYLEGTFTGKFFTP